MRQNRFKSPKSRKTADPKLGRMVVVSLAAHVIVVLLFSGFLLPRMERKRRPVYYVDLVNLPVQAPQAGRPDAGREKPKKTKAAPKPAVPKKAPPPAPKKPAKKVAPKPAPAKKAAPKKEPPAPQEDYGDALSAIEKLKRKKEIEALQEKIAALADQDRRQAPPDAPAGMVDGKGDEEGISYDAWIYEYLKRAWTLSKYQVSRRDLEAEVLLVFDRNGRLIDYRFLEESGEKRFDDSVKKAVLQLKELPNPPGSRLEKEVVFNLKELLKE